MKYLAPLTVLLPLVLAQDVTVPSTCTGNFSAGTDEVLYTVPYTYDQVLSIIGNYSNLTWSGSPEGSVTLNGTDNTVGVARTYDLAGAHIIETILTYEKPAAPGPYVEVHNTALINVGGVEAYIPFDGTVVSSVCDGRASMFNFTANFCASNVSAAAALLHQIHLGDAMTVGVFLGGENFTSCDAIGMAANGTSSMGGMASGTMGAPAGTYTGGAVRERLGWVGVFVGVVLMVGSLA